MSPPISSLSSGTSMSERVSADLNELRFRSMMAWSMP